MKRLRSLLLVCLLTILGTSVPSFATPPITIYYVKIGGSDLAAGTDWTTAFATLQKALSVAASGEEIWVAQGTYYPDEGGSFADNDRNAAFTMLNGVSIYGGFSGNGTETLLSQRNWATNPTILSGDIDKNNTLDNGNAYHVIYNNYTSITPLTNTSVLDGFSIIGGRANGSGFLSYGAGMYNNNSSPSITNCSFSGNSADLIGAGMYNSVSSPSITNCSFSGNSANQAGGGIANIGSGSVFTPSINNCSFSGNSATLYGGGIYNGSTSPSITNCTFSGNSSPGQGGGMASTAPNIISPNPVVKNCIFWGNSSEIYLSSGFTAVTYSIVKQTSGVFSGTGNLNVDPLFVNSADADGADNILGTSDDGLRLQACSPAIDAGTSTAAPTTDILGNARVDAIAGGNIVDMGAYEYQSILQLQITSAASTPIICQNDGTITAVGSTCQLVGTITYSINGVGGNTANTTGVFSGLPSGNYTVTVYDSGNITNFAVTTVTVGISNTAPVVTATVTAALCNGGNGKITLTVASGTAPYDYEWDGPGANDGSAINVASHTINPAPPGTYAIKATDSNGCETTTSAIVTEPAINVLGNGVVIADGDVMPSASDHTDFGTTSIGVGFARTFTIQNTGGAPFSVSSITSNNTHFVVSGVPASVAANSSATFMVTFTPTVAGAQNATITINNDNCVYDFAVTGNGTCPTITINTPAVTQPTCATPTGTIVVNASVAGGGTLEYSADNGSNWQSSATFSGLAVGNHNIKVRLQATPSCEATYANNPVALNSPFSVTTTDTWTGCVSTDWNTAGNWQDGTVPTATDDVTIPAAPSNQPIIGAGTAAVAKSVLINASASLTINATGSLAINGATGFALENYGTLDNSGTIRVGNTSSVGNIGIVQRNGGTLNNKTGGAIYIDRTGGNQAFYTSGVVNNEATIEIGSNAAVTGTGLSIDGSGTLNNKTDGRLAINQPTQGGLEIIGALDNKGLLTINGTMGFGIENHSTLDNSGTIRVGNTSSVGNRGIVHRNGGTLNNKTGGLIQIDRTSAVEAFYTSGLVNNEATIEIGSNAAVTGNGITVDGGIFNNNAGGEISIKQTTTNGIISNGTFSNNACAKLTMFDNLNNVGTFTNGGLFTVNTSQAHTNSALTNNGTIEYPQGNPIPNVTNNDVIVAPIFVCGTTASPALQIGGANSFTAGAIWYTDNALTTQAGTYNQGTNTFTLTNLALTGTQTLYLSINDNVNSCSRVVSIQVTIIGSIVYVTPTGAGLQNGSSWANAFSGTQVQLAINTAANCGAQVWVAKGTYYPRADETGNTSPTDPRLKTFVMKSGVGIYGGFVGNEAANYDLSLRNFVSNETILSGDIDQNNTLDNGNAYNVLINFYTNNTAILDGFTVSGGYYGADAGFPDRKARGSAIFNYSSSPSIRNCIFSKNVGFYGNIYNLNSNATFTNCVFVQNQGNVFWNETDGNTSLINCTFSANANTSIANVGTTNAVVKNCIIWGNGGGISGTGVTVTNSIVQGGYVGTGNLNQDPLFVNQPTIGSGATGDLRLLACSPALDKGDDADNTTTSDVSGNPRKFESIAGGSLIDMGAYERQQLTYSGTILYVDQAVSSSGDGSSWAAAFKTLQEALQLSCPNVTQIWVAKGTYYPTADASRNFSPTDARTKTFVMKNGVAIYGGFVGNEAADYNLSLRNFTANQTILSGDIDGTPDVVTGSGSTLSITGNGGNAYHVVFNNNNGLTNTAVLDGFTVSGGNANAGSNPNNLGGGMLINNVSPTITNCTFSHNYAGAGGGFYYSATSGSLTISRCIFSLNIGGNGGGVFNRANLALNNCQISENRTSGSGGGIYNSPGSLSMTSCQVNGNDAALNFGGGIFSFRPLTLSFCQINNNSSGNGGGIVQGNQQLIMTNCEVKNNRTVFQGSGVNVQDVASATLTNCEISGNVSQNSQGGICNLTYLSTSSLLTLINCTVANNTSVGGYRAIWTTIASNGQNATTILKNTIVANNPGGNFLQADDPATPTLFGTVQSQGNNLDSDGSSGFTNGVNGDLVNVNPLFVSATDVHLQACSPAINVGDNTANATTTDLDGSNRKFGVIDLGAYEYQNNAVAPPTATANTTTPSVCVGSTINLSASGGNTFSWAGPSGSNFNSTAQNPSFAASNTSYSGLYTVTVSNQDCPLTATATVSVQVNANPSAGINPSATSICAGGSINLTGTGGNSYSWATSSGGNFTSTTGSPTAWHTTNSSGTYNITVTAGDGTCTAMASITVAVNTIPSAGINPSATSICAGGSISLSGTGGSNYSWSASGGNFTSTTGSPTSWRTTNSSGTYNITVTTGSGTCTATASLTVLVNANPSAGINPSVTSICAGGSISLSGTGGSNYTWSASGGNFTSTTGSPTSWRTTGSSGTYSITVTAGDGTCTATTFTTVTVNINPIAGINPSATSICAGGSINLTGTGGNSYSWATSSGGNFTSTTGSPTAWHTTNSSGTYNITVTAGDGTCTAMASITVAVNTIPSAGINPSATSICAGGSISLSGTGGSNYTWSASGGNFTSTTGSPTSWRTTNSSGTFSITVTAGIGTCTATATVSVQVNALPTVSISPPTSQVCVGTTVNLTATADLSSYSWNRSGGTFTSTTNQATFSSNTAGGYSFTVTATNSSSCTATATASVMVNPSPNISTQPASQTLTEGTNLTLSVVAANATVYQWQKDNANFGSSSASPSLNLGPATLGMSGTYKVIVSGTCGSATSSAAIVTVTPSASFASSNSPVCIGLVIDLKCQKVGTAYTWLGPDRWTSNLKDPSRGKATEAMGGVYSVSVKSGGVVSSATTSVLMVDKNAVSASSNTPVLVGNTIQLSADGGDAFNKSYAWTGPSSFSSTLQNPTRPNAQLTHKGKYIVTFNGACGTATASISVVVNAATRIASGEDEGEALISIEASPNPSSDVVRVKVKLAKASGLQIDIIDASGRRLESKALSDEKQVHEFELNLSERMEGLYLLMVKTNEGLMKTKRLVKQ